MGIPKVAGIETEYGVMLVGAALSDPFLPSHLLLQAYRGASTASGSERLDLSDRMLANGARYYIDHAHPEYSTPECLSPRELVAADKAGERIVAACQQQITRSHTLPPGQEVRAYKNNSDYKNNSYGCHENYLLDASFFSDLQDQRSARHFQHLLPFLITRSIVCGAGKIGAEHGRAPVGFQLSQRADFFETLSGLQTTTHRPLFNIRDEPHADARLYRRLHVIAGDANMAEFSTYLKIGTTQLVLLLLEDHALTEDCTLRSPLAAMHTVSRDLTFTHLLQLADGRQMTALDLQEHYLDLAYRYLDERGGSDQQYAVLQAWEDVLSFLPAHWEKLATRLDWAIKRRFLERYLQTQATTWDTVAAWQPVIEAAIQGQDAVATASRLTLPWNQYEKQRALYFALRRLDLHYHDIRVDEQGEVGLFYHLQQQGAIERLVTEEEIGRLMTDPPCETRAWLRGQCISRFGELVTAADWDRVCFAHASLPLELADPLLGSEAMMAAIWPDLHDPELVASSWPAASTRTPAPEV